MVTYLIQEGSSRQPRITYPHLTSKLLFSLLHFNLELSLNSSNKTISIKIILNTYSQLYLYSSIYYIDIITIPMLFGRIPDFLAGSVLLILEMNVAQMIPKLVNFLYFLQMYFIKFQRIFEKVNKIILIFFTHVNFRIIIKIISTISFFFSKF